jgi:DNA-binding Lrp family transcriptional regulator
MTKDIPASGLYWTELRIFLEVAKSKSFNKAAEELGISQPTVGRAVRRLETALNIKLLGAGARRGAYACRFKIGASAGVGRRGNREDHPQSRSGVDEERC